jgi:hypothetical protein
VALLAISVAVLPCPACYAPQTGAAQQLPASGRACCHKHPAPEKASNCGWMPADNGQPEAKTDISKIIGFFAILGLETAVFSSFLDTSQTVADFPRDSAPVSPPGLTISLRC